MDCIIVTLVKYVEMMEHVQMIIMEASLVLVQVATRGRIVNQINARIMQHVQMILKEDIHVRAQMATRE